MSLKKHNNLNKEISIYRYTCIPCMSSPSFRKNDCKTCKVMNEYTELQEIKKRLEDE